MNETLQTLHALRTIHGNFSDQPISEPDLQQILAAAVRTANASARQSYSLIVLRDREVMRDLLTYQGSCALVFCVDFSRLMAAAHYLGHLFNNDDIIGFITAGIDTALAAQTAVIAAKSLGIDSLITNALHRKPLELVYQALNLPETSCFPLISVVLGYPREEPDYLKGRLSTEFVVHEGQYHPLTEPQLARLVAEYDDHDKHLGLINNWEKLGFAHYLDWFYTKWCGLPDTQRIPTGKVLEFQEQLLKSGFWWPVLSE